jgi:phenylacetic acid degradation operon negative regulatory protein
VTGPRRPKTLILDVYGAYVRELGGWLAVSDLVALMALLGVEERAVRSAVSRMAGRGLLLAEERRGARGYRLTAKGLAILAEGDRRIFAARSPAELTDGWVLAAFSVPERERSKRHLLRTRLMWLGFGRFSDGLWIAPGRVLPDLTEVVRALGFEPYVDVFRADYLGFEDLVEVIRRAWDLEAMRSRYRGFLDATEPVLRRWAGSRRPDGRAAFADYTLSLHRWRTLPYLDPGLPTELLPPEWEGARAAEAFREVRARLERPAARFVEGIVQR